MDFEIISTKDMPINQETKIYRYIGLETLLAIIEEGRMPLRRITKFEDPLEAPTRLLKLPNLDIQKKISKGAEHIFVSCWSQKNQNDSDALWRIYSHDKRGVCIESTIGKLKSVLENANCPIGELAVVGPVIYEEHKNFILNHMFGRLYFEDYGSLDFVFNKRPAFAHEDEIRLIVITNDVYPEDMCLLENINCLQMIQKVWIDPRSDAWVYSAVKAYLQRVGIDCDKSDLYNSKEFEIKGSATATVEHKNNL